MLPDSGMNPKTAVKYESENKTERKKKGRQHSKSKLLVGTKFHTLMMD